MRGDILVFMLPHEVLEEITWRREHLGVSASGNPWSVEAGKEVLEGEKEVVERITFPGRSGI